MEKENFVYRNYKILSLLLIFFLFLFLIFVIFVSTDKIGNKGQTGDRGPIGDLGPSVIIGQNIKIKKIFNPENIRISNFTNILYVFTITSNFTDFSSVSINSFTNWDIGTQCYFYNSFISEHDIHVGFSCENDGSSTCSQTCVDGGFTVCGTCDSQIYYLKNENQCYNLKPKDLLTLTRISFDELFIEYTTSNYLLNN